MYRTYRRRKARIMKLNWLLKTLPTRCASSTCVDVARNFENDGVVVRSTLAPDTTVAFTDAEWSKFLADAKAGHWDRSLTPEAQPV